MEESVRVHWPHINILTNFRKKKNLYNNRVSMMGRGLTSVVKTESAIDSGSCSRINVRTVHSPPERRKHG